MLWVAMTRTTIQRISTLASKVARTALARRLWSDRARRRVREAEVRAAQARGQAAESRALFVARISHELRTPLQTIVAGLELLQRRGTSAAISDPSLSALLERLTRSADQVLTLSHDLADFVRWESGTLPVRRVDVDVPQLVQDIATGLSERARLRGVHLSTRHTGPPGTNLTDAARLRAIVTNLLNNAIKYAPSGAVQLTTERDPTGFLVIVVQDNGPGLPESVLRVLGSPWVRGDNARVQEEGFGLGLSIVMTLAQEIDAEVRPQSSADGTTFRVVLDRPEHSHARVQRS
jgi:signal transduction histidine kinase